MIPTMSSAMLALIILGGPVEAPIPESSTVAEFKQRDLDEDGMLTRKEYVKPNLGSKWEEAARRQAVLYDLNGDGMLSPVEFARTPPGKASPATMFNLLDSNADKILNPQEFSQRHRPVYADATKLEFSHFDADGSGRIERGEYLKRGETPAGEFVRRFSQRDEDGDGKLSRAEYVRPNLGGKWEEAAKKESVRYDRDGDGFLTAVEFALTPPTEASPAMRFALGDVNDDEVIDRKEFANVHPDVDRVTIGARFLRYDKDRDGQVSAAEWNREGWEQDAVFDPVIARVEKEMAAFAKLLGEFDQGGDGKLGAGEWPTEQITTALPNLAGLDQSAWDRNEDGEVAEEEARRLLEVAWGVRRPSGESYRRPTGHVFNWDSVRKMDENGDADLSREEFVEGYRTEREKSLEIFKEIDANDDGNAAFGELAASRFIYDVLSAFSRLDANADGRLDQAELDATPRAWETKMTPHLIAAFDDDGDSRLDFREFRLTPLANPYANWYSSPPDTDHDGRLSWEEFYSEDSPIFMALYREFFRRFDRDQDGSLSPDEFEYRIDLKKIPDEIAFAVQDRDGNGRISFTEVFDEPRPEGDDPKQVEAYQMRLIRAEESFLTGDGDGDGAIGLPEFRAARENAATTAAVLGPSVAPRRKSDGGLSWPIMGFLALDALVLLGVGVWFLRGSQPKSRSN